ncbi:hypothetical protein B0189_02085 [Moraxella cuniculi]|uniref:hypothetical protein n=1 Tax=Moraxella cuniculi TaxID=34061 RepID=UPI0009932C10|nr:hypothetical protein [Moraxella cuniculi]OOS07679.1 hypothetical protein B0189_02085 [Moraxella cuniculi]
MISTYKENRLFILLGIWIVVILSIPFNYKYNGYHVENMYQISKKLRNGIVDNGEFSQKISYAVIPYYHIQYSYGNDINLIKDKVMQNIINNNYTFLMKKYDYDNNLSLVYCYKKYQININEMYDKTRLSIHIIYDIRSDCNTT